MGFGVLPAAVSPVLGLLFSDDRSVTDAVVPLVLHLPVATPLAGFVSVFDCVLIGGNDFRYRALSGILNLAC